jgi:hypothetical protein
MVGASVRAQETGEPSRVLTVRRATGQLRIDGRLDEADWARADSVTDFRQREPEVGAAATERTVAKVLRDDDGLIIGIRAADREPALIRATQLRRDADLESDDYLTLLIDSFHDRRNGFLFATNPNGAMWDAQLVGTEGEDDNWNGIWTVATTRDEGGWAAEFRIPFRTLRFESGGGAAFGFNVRRFIRRKNEEVLWQAWGRQQGLRRLQYAGDLVGLGVLTRARDIELKPFVLARAYAPERDVDGMTTSPASSGAKVGLDAKLAVSPTLTADLTANTDFAQVEADRQVINLSRFPLFFPEKRDFFLESGGIFAFGSSSQSQLFYSRRIGVLDGREVPILGGARLYGRSGAWTLGLLDARTGGVDGANDAVLRVKRDVFERSYLGGMLTHRSGPGVDGTETGFGLDADFPFVVGDQNIQPAFWVAGTRDPGVSSTPIAWRASLDYPNDLFDNFVSLSRIDSAFNPALGFVRRAGLVQSTGTLRYRPRPRIPGIRQLELMPIPAWNIVADYNGRITDSRTWQTAELEWRPFAGELRSGGDFEFNIQREFDAPPEDFEVFGDVTIPAGRYWFTRWQAQYSTSSARTLSGEIDASWGDYYDGRSTELQLAGTWRGGGHVILGAEVTRTSAALPTGSFIAVETAGRLEYAFNPRTSFLGFVQYNNEDRRADFNLRFHWIPTIGDDVYLVWNSGYTTDPDARFRFPSSRALTRPLNGALVIKAVHRFVP